MEIPINKYQTNSIYVLSNGWFIDLDLNENLTTLRVKSPEGAVFHDFTRIISQEIFSNPQNLKASIDSDVTFLSSYLSAPELKVTSINPKENIPLRKVTNKIRVVGKVTTKEGTPIPEVQIDLNFFTKPPPAFTLPEPGTEVNSLEEFENSQTDFETTNFTIGSSALVLTPKFTKDDGTFVVELLEEDNVDFSTSYIDLSKEEYFPKSIGPTLIKSGEVIENLPPKDIPPSNATFPTQIINESLFQQEDGKYKAEIVLKNLDTGDTEQGIGISQDREIAKSKANFRATTALAKKINENIAQQEGDQIKFDVYDIGRITLEPVKVNVEENVVEAQIQIQQQENKIVEQQAVLNTPFELKLASIFNFLKERLKRVLLAYVLNLLSKFGPDILNNILKRVKGPLKNRICLPPDELERILEKRNKLTRQLNNLFKVVKTISKILKVTQAVIFGLQIGIKVATLTSTPITFSAQISEGIAILKRILNKAEPTVSSLTITAATVGFLLSYILELLKELDNLIQDCAEEIDPETGEFALSFERINVEINSFEDPTIPGEEQDIIDPLTGKPFPYKGFTFEIKTDITQNFQYPKRYAIARNVQGIQVLRSESSFASNPSILIEELKFVIDRDNLRAD